MPALSSALSSNLCHPSTRFTPPFISFIVLQNYYHNQNVSISNFKLMKGQNSIKFIKCTLNVTTFLFGVQSAYLPQPFATVNQSVSV